MRVRESALAVGLDMELVDGQDWSRALESEPPPELAVVDLTAPDAIPAVALAVAARVPVLAFGPHVDEATLDAARDAGASEVVPRGRMMREAGTLMLRAARHSG